LAKYANISALDSNHMADFEREAHLHMIIKSLREEVESIKGGR